MLNCAALRAGASPGSIRMVNVGRNETDASTIQAVGLHLPLCAAVGLLSAGSPLNAEEPAAMTISARSVSRSRAGSAAARWFLREVPWENARGE